MSVLAAFSSPGWVHWGIGWFCALAFASVCDRNWLGLVVCLALAVFWTAFQTTPESWGF